MDKEIRTAKKVYALVAAYIVITLLFTAAFWVGEFHLPLGGA